jgi:NAD(P)H dehydrogenase (quinone)
MAELVARGASSIQDTEVRLKAVYEAGREDVIWCDGLALGSPTYPGTVSSPMKKFWEDLLPDWQKLDGKIGCAFSSRPITGPLRPAIRGNSRNITKETRSRNMATAEVT